MKQKLWLVVLHLLFLAALATPAAAKVDLKGALWVTYWAQQEASSLRAQASDGAQWIDQPAGIGGHRYGGTVQASKKTFLLSQDVSGGALNTSARAARGDGFTLAGDCPVNDWVKGYFRISVTNPGAINVSYLWAQLDFSKAASLRAGLFKLPFGNETLVRTSIGRDEVFISEYSQDPLGALQSNREVGLHLTGKLFEAQVSYQAFVANGSIRTVADSTAAAVGPNTPDGNDAKEAGVYAKWTPISGLFVGGSYATGDYTSAFASNNNRPRFTGYTVFGGYDALDALLLTAEYATVRHDQLTLDFQGGATPSGGFATAARVNEYILKAIYHGLPDWELGVRYSVIDPKNLEAEVGAGYSNERKLTFGSAWQFAANARLKAEYSILMTDLTWLDKLDAAAVPANSIRVLPTEEPDDNIFALQLALQF